MKASSKKSRSGACAPLLQTWLFGILAVFTLCFSLALYPACALAEEGEQTEQSDQAEQSDQTDNNSASQDSSNQVYVNQPADSSFLYETSIADLALADSYYEGQTVQVKGEAVGDLVNDEFNAEDCWVTLLDPDDVTSVVSVSMTKQQAEAIDLFGEYGQTGTILQVRGTFHLECREHQGLTDIHAEAVSAVAPGSTYEESVDMRIVCAGAAAVAVGLVLMGIYYLLRERRL